MGLFSGLEKLGFHNANDVKVFESETTKKTQTQANMQNGVAQMEKKETDFLFDKTYVCPVCDSSFVSKTIKTGKIKTISHDSDLRPVFAHVDSLKYDAIVCPNCGFAALTRFFKPTSPTQNKWIREQITSQFCGYHEPEDVYSYDDAILMHKLALMSSIAKHAKLSERSYCCLKIAWLYRGKSENTDDAAKKEEIHREEMQFIEKAYEGFYEAFSNEQFPMCGMDETTVTYLISDLARQLGKYDIAKRWISMIILSKTANGRIKDKARELRDRIDHERDEALDEIDLTLANSDKK